ncbi:hypothetical protein [Vibrio sp. HN007]|uniref:hypothetical protein n=1 Tax=Vibrio iocasae TaxID=3098914 RepID=UPI0035D4BB9F
MEISECRRKLAAHVLVDANIVHDVNTCGWHVNFHDNEGNEVPFTDNLEIPLSFNSPEDAKMVLHQIGDCPVKVNHLFGFYAI